MTFVQYHVLDNSAMPWSDARWNYYNFHYTPSAVFNGYDVLVGSLHDIEQQYNVYRAHHLLPERAVPTDVTDEAQLTRLVQNTLDRFGRIDILLSNAGIIQGGVVAEGDFGSIRRQIEVNLMASMRLAQLALRPMLAQGQGHIVLMASIGGRHSSPYLTGYCASKHGLVGFGEGLRRELVGKGVRVLTVNPGYTATDMVNVAEPAYRRMGFRMIPPERVARLTLEGIILGTPEFTIGLMETIGQWGSAMAPALFDLYWRVFMPPEFPELVSKQKTE